ncbi:MAG TPA: hypothetical protein VII61_15760 [Ktedonobacteraceae bacterium]
MLSVRHRPFLIPVAPRAIRKVAHRQQEGCLDRRLSEKQRPRAAALLEDSQRQRTIGTAVIQ